MDPENLQATEPDLSGLTVHLKIDSGMGRIGFRSAFMQNRLKLLAHER